MIKSIKDKGLKEFFLSGDEKGLNQEQAGKIKRVLALLDEVPDSIDINFSGNDLCKIKSETLKTLIARASLQMHNPPHPGEILMEEYLVPLGFTVSAFAEKISTSRKNLSAIVNKKVAISSEMALKLAKALGTSPEIWLRLQLKYDLFEAKRVVNLENVEVVRAQRVKVSKKSRKIKKAKSIKN